MFTNLFVGELKKSFGKLLTIIMAAIFVLVISIMTYSIHDMFESMQTSLPDGEDGEVIETETGVSYTRQEITDGILLFEAQIVAIEREVKKAGFSYYQMSYDVLYEAKANLNMYKYIQENELYDTPLVVNRGVDMVSVMGGGDSTLSADEYLVLMLSIISYFVMVYGIIIASGSFAKEYKDGTLKILFLRPITRTKLLLAKALSILTITTLAYLACFIFAVIISYSVFPIEINKALFSFNGGAFSQANSDFQIFIAFFVGLIETLSMVFLAFFFGTLTRNRIWGIAIPMLLEGMGQFLIYTGLARFFIVDAINISQYVGVSGSITAGGNFFISLPVYLVYMVGLGLGTYVSVLKRDLA